MLTSENQNSSKKLRLVRTVICLLILCVVATAVYFYYQHPLKNNRTSLYGYTITTPVKFSHLTLQNQVGERLPAKQWQNKWIIFNVIPLPCRQVCQANLQKLELVNKDNMFADEHAIDVVVATFYNDHKRKFAHLISHQYPSLIHVRLNVASFKRVFAHIKSRRRAIFAGMTYIVNPHGKVVLSYENNATEEDINTDLKRLTTTTMAS